MRHENGSMSTSLAQQLPQLYTPLITKAKAASKALQFAASKMVFFCALIVYLLKMFILMLDILMNYVTLMLREKIIRLLIF